MQWRRPRLPITRGDDCSGAGTGWPAAEKVTDTWSAYHYCGTRCSVPKGSLARSSAVHPNIHIRCSKLGGHGEASLGDSSRSFVLARRRWPCSLYHGEEGCE